MLTILAGLLVLGIVISFHEAAHMIIAKWNGVHVPVYSIGFGPVLFSKKWGETEYRISIIPFGGYVKLAGHGDDEDMRRGIPKNKLFSSKSAWRRFAIVAAGPVSNYLLSFFIITTLLFFIGRPQFSTKIDKVYTNTPASKADIMPGDKIIKIDNVEIKNIMDIQAAINRKNGSEVWVDILRINRIIRKKIKPEKKIEFDEVMKSSQTYWLIGIKLADPIYVDKYRPFFSMKWACLGIDRFNKLNISGIYKMIFDKRTKVKDNLAGPVTIMRMSGQVARQGVISLIGFVALISLAIGFMNFIPIPGLDGCYMAFYGIEIIFRKPLPIRVQNAIIKYGVMLLLMLATYVLYLDFLRLA